MKELYREKDNQINGINNTKYIPKKEELHSSGSQWRVNLNTYSKIMKKRSMSADHYDFNRRLTLREIEAIGLLECAFFLHPHGKTITILGDDWVNFCIQVSGKSFIEYLHYLMKKEDASKEE